jgi:WD40 repeat protein
VEDDGAEEEKPRYGKRLARKAKAKGMPMALWLGLGGGGVAIAAAIVLVIVLNQGNSKSNPSANPQPGDTPQGTAGGGGPPDGTPPKNSGTEAPALPEGVRELAKLEGHEGIVNCLAFSPDGKTLASGDGQRTIKLWDVATGKESATLSGHHGQIRSLSFSPDGGTLAAGDALGVGCLWDVASHQPGRTLGPFQFGLNGPAFAGEGIVVVGGPIVLGNGGELHAQDARTGAEKGKAAGPDRFKWLAVSPDGKTLASASPQAGINFYDLPSCKLRSAAEDAKDIGGSLVYSPDGALLAAPGRSSETGKQAAVMLWDAASGKRLGALDKDHGLAGSLAFSPDGKTLAVSGGLGVVAFWDVPTRTEKAVLKTGAVPVLAFSPTAKVLALTEIKTVKLWDVSKFLD